MSLKYKLGLLGGILSIVFITAEHLLIGGDTNHRYTTYGAVIALAILIRIAVQRQTALPHQTTLLLFKSGLTVAAIAGLVMGAYRIAFYRWIAPEHLSNQLAAMVEEMKALGHEEVTIEQVQNSFQQMHSPLMELGSTVIQYLIVGTLISFLATLLFKKKLAAS